jgi:opacity protein-like surface antigen
MRNFFVSAALAAAVAAPLQAQRAGDPVTSGHGSFFVGPYAGYMVFGDLAESSAGEFSNEDGGFYGVQAGWSFSPNFTLLANMGWTKSKFTFESEGGPTFDQSGDIGIWLYDADLQFRLPFQQRDSWIAPFAQVGAGAIRYTAETDDFESDAQTNVAFNAGIGADFQWMESVGVRLMVKDYMTSLEWDDDEDIGDTFDDGDMQHNWAFTIGLNFGF